MVVTFFFDNVNIFMQLCDYYYKIQVWIETYRNNIKPVNGEFFGGRLVKTPLELQVSGKCPDVLRERGLRQHMSYLQDLTD